ncbi:hypothetical protein BP6252_02882 [Coleophoma cylindrospora]|uniref:Uncharacterized protein n=1 Tax=Coleophoma cylindrospora TaxID=1849047 RepID=A0A3D8SG65_9HELO|nr:hypothetical protein BP6252_02882 [Coleophoma cylindrospora]
MEQSYGGSLARVVTICSAFAALYVSYCVGVVIYNIYFHPLSKYPGPRLRAGMHAVDLWHVWNGDQPVAVAALHEIYGDVVRTRPDTLSYRTAQAFKDIYGTRAGKHQLRKDPRSYTITGEEQTHIVYSNDADHARMRKLLSHAFSDAALRQQEPTMHHYFELMVRKLEDKIDNAGGEVDISKWYNFITFDIIGDMCFGEPFNALDSGNYHYWMSNLFNGIKYSRILVIAAFYKPALPILMAIANLFPTISKARKEHQTFTRLKTEKRLEAKTDRIDFMTYILRHNDERGMSKEELMETSGLLILAGSETTATLLSGATYYLLQTPRVYAKVKEEVRAAFKDAQEITLTSTARLPYLHAVIEEALRLYPPVPFALLRKTPPEGDMINGEFVPGDTCVGVNHYAAYHTADHFYEPKVFAPERWLPDRPEQYRNDRIDVLNPFSIGPRNCIGKNLAYNEMRSILARMLWHFEMELLPSSNDWQNQKSYFLWEKPDLNVKLSHRKLE